MWANCAGIPENQRQRLLAIGKWLADNGEAIYGTRPWKIYGSEGIRFTKKENVLYAIFFDWPGSPVTLDISDNLKDGNIRDLMLLGGKGLVSWKIIEGKLIVDFTGDKSTDHAHTLKITFTH